jgi:4-diphosphocytidyl-2-C-methyl-D-erythritol kinase
LHRGDASSIENDFEAAVFEQFPEVGAVKRQLLDSSALVASMSGSGSSVYGFFTDEASAQDAIQKFSHTYRTILTAPGFRPDLEIH